MLFDLSYSEGAFIAKEDLRSTFLQIKGTEKMPVFALDKENFMTNIPQLSGLKDIDFKEYPDFSKRFYLRGEDEKAIRTFLQAILFTSLKAIQLTTSNPMGIVS